MKRAAAFQDLSRDHFTALVAARHVERSAEAHELAPSFEHATNAFLALWNTELSAHFDEEDANLAPVLAHQPEAASLLARLQRDHRDLRMMFARLNAESPKLDWVETARRLRDHVRWEEDELFQWLQEALRPAELDQLFQDSVEFRLRVRGKAAVQAPSP